MTNTSIPISARIFLFHLFDFVSVPQTFLSDAIDGSHYHFGVIVQVRILLKVDYLSNELTLLKPFSAVTLVGCSCDACNLVGIVSGAGSDAADSCWVPRGGTLAEVRGSFSRTEVSRRVQCHCLSLCLSHSFSS
jgi:hypothetical protein